MPINWDLVFPAIQTILGATASGVSQIRAGNANYRIAVVNAESILKIAEANARLIEEGTEANARVSDFNAKMLEAKARDAIYRGKQDEGRFRVGIRGVVGSQRASFAAQGIEVNDGSSLDVQMDTAYQGELDAQTIRVNAGRESWGYQVEAEGERIQADAIRKTGKLQAGNVREVGRTEAMNQRMQGGFNRDANRNNGISTILTAGAQVLNASYGFTRRGK